MAWLGLLLEYLWESRSLVLDTCHRERARERGTVEGREGGRNGERKRERDILKF